MAQSAGSISKQSQSKWRRSLPFRVGLLQALVAAVLLLVSLWIIFGVQEQERREQELSLNLSQGQLMLAKLQHMTAQLNTLAIAIADVAANPHHTVDIIEHTLPSLLSLPPQQDMIASGGVWPEPGFPLGRDGKAHSLFWVRDMLGELNINDGYNDERGYLEEDWYKPVRLFPAGRVYWSPSYTDPHTRESMVSAAAPIWKDHQYQGTATLDVSLTSLNKFTVNAGKELHGYAMIFDQFNRILAAPAISLPSDPGTDAAVGPVDIDTLVQQHSPFEALSILLKKADNDFILHARENPVITQEQLLATTGEVYPAHKAMYQALVNNSVRGVPQSAQLLGTVEMARDPVLGESTLVSVYLMPETFWKVVTVTPKLSLKHEALLLAERAGLYLLLAQFLALLLMYLIQKDQFIRPIARMVRALKSNNAAYLELDAAGREDEIGILAKAFVARTQQLEVAKASLDASNLALEQQLAVQAEAQQDLQSHREHLLALLKSSPNLIYIKDTNGRYILVNDKFCETIGLDRHRVLGATDQQLFSSDLALSYSDSDRRVLAQDAPLQVEDTLPTRMGEQRFQFTKFTIRDEDDNLKGLGAIAFDIQNRKRHDEEQQAKLQSLENSLSELTQLKARQELRLQQLEQQLAEQSARVTLDDAKDRAWQTERRLLRSWQRSWLDSLMHEHDRLLALACQRGEDELESIRTELMQSSHRLRLADNLISKHRSNQVAQPLSLLQELKSMLEPELLRQGITVSIDGDARCAAAPEVWQLTLLFFQLLRQIASLEAFDTSAAHIDIHVEKTDSACVVRFDRQGVSTTLIDDDIGPLNQWLSEQCGASLTKRPSLGSALILDCTLPLASQRLTSTT